MEKVTDYEGTLPQSEHRKYVDMVKEWMGSVHDVMRVPPEGRLTVMVLMHFLCRQLRHHPMAETFDDDDGCSGFIEGEEAEATAAAEAAAKRENGSTWALGAGSLTPKLLFLLDGPTEAEIRVLDTSDDEWPKLEHLRKCRSDSLCNRLLQHCDDIAGLELERDVAIMYLCPFPPPLEEDVRNPGRMSKRTLSRQERELFWTPSRRVFEVLRAPVVVAAGAIPWAALDASLLHKRTTSGKLGRIPRMYYETSRGSPPWTEIIKGQMRMSMTRRQQSQHKAGWDVTAYFLEHSYFLKHRDYVLREKCTARWMLVMRTAWRVAEDLHLLASSRRGPPRDLAAQLKATLPQPTSPPPPPLEEEKKRRQTSYDNIMTGYLAVKKRKMLLDSS